MKNILVFCGSTIGNNETYKITAALVGATLAERRMRIIYGAARIGLMGTIADEALKYGGEVVGIIPDFLKTKEVAHESLTELITVETMHERKLKMYDMADGVIALPGGWGTMDELFEILTWSQLGLHNKPIGLLNVNRYYDPLITMCDTMVNEGFLSAQTRQMLMTSDSLTDLLEKMEAYQPAMREKWISEGRT